jgi:hypothetical protein
MTHQPEAASTMKLWSIYTVAVLAFAAAAAAAYFLDIKGIL